MLDMIETICKRLIKLLESNQIPLFLFFSSLFIYLSFASTRMFITDEGVVLNQFYNLNQGSISLETWKIKTSKAVYLLFNDHAYGKFSYSLVILSLPFYYILRTIDFLYGAHLFMLQLWALSGGMIVYFIAKNRNIKYAVLVGALSYFSLIAINMYFFKPIYFPMWGELLSIEFTNILISSFLVLFIYLLFRNFFGDMLAVFASLFIVLATPISFYAVTLKHHALSLLLTILAFYFFYKYIQKKDNKFIYFAYALAGLCVWTRVLDGAVLLLSLLITDLLISRRSIKYILSISAVIIISLIPFFGFNYLILGNPFSIMEKTSSSGNPVTLQPGQDVIILDESSVESNPGNFLRKLGYSNNLELKSDWYDVLLDITFLKLRNTFGIFLVSPFLIIALAFVVDRVKRKIKLSTTDKFFGLYTILFVYFNMDYILMIITDTPHVLDYRYLLILYITLLYFALRIDRVRDLIEPKLKLIAILYVIILAIFLIYFIEDFPVPFLNIYYYAALFTSLSLIIMLSISLLTQNKKSHATLLDNPILFIVALSIALSSIFLLFYYWIVSMTYISPSQNYTILPVLDSIQKWMYQKIL